ncbi:hypothetical protein ACHAXA_003827 [Cyclostephanos tholiformis]|uniref:HMG box domain-containing protein n=1 Tax=Cyclostephanos tholiformis TaxID=382380 RepID=A0ABD3RWI1_9STRA
MATAVPAPGSTPSSPPPEKEAAGGEGAHRSPSPEALATSVKDADTLPAISPPTTPTSPASAPEEGGRSGAHRGMMVAVKSPMPKQFIDMERITAPRGKAYERLLSSGSTQTHATEGHVTSTNTNDPATEIKEDNPEEAPEKCIAVGNNVAREEGNGGGGESCDEDNPAGRNVTTDNGNAVVDGDAVITKDVDGGGGDPAAPPAKGGFRPKMPRKRASMIMSPTNPTLSQDDGSTSSTFHDRRHRKEDVEPSKKRKSLFDPAEYHAKVCLPQKRRLIAKQNKTLKAMNKRLVGIYGSNPSEEDESRNRGRSGGNSASRQADLVGQGGGWDGRARRVSGMCSSPWDMPMGGSLSLTASPVSTGRDNLSSLMPGMSPAFDPRALSTRLRIGNRGDVRGYGRGGTNGSSDIIDRNPELFEHMARMMNAGGGTMMGIGKMSSSSIGGVDKRIGGLGSNQEEAINSLPITGDSYHYGGNYNEAYIRNYFKDALYSAHGNVGMMGDEPSHLPPKSPGNPKKTFLQRERVMDAEMRTQMREALLKENMKNTNRLNLPFLTTPNLETPSNQDALCMETDDAMTVESVQQISSLKSKDTSKSQTEENQATKKKTAPSLPKRSKKTKFDSNAEMENPTQEELKATILAVMGMPEKPKRPFSLYNLFFQLEREHILNEIREGRKPLKLGEGLPVVAGCTGKSSITDVQPCDPDYFHDPDIPARYSHLKLEKYWYSVGHKQKRKHRKTDGSCSFMELTRMVSSCWKTIDTTDPYIKEYCQKLAKQELEDYKRENEKYKKAVKKAELEAKAKMHLIDMKAAELSIPANSQKSADEGAPERMKKLRGPVDEDVTPTCTDTTKPEGRPNPEDLNLQNPYYGRNHFGRVVDMMDGNGFMMGGGGMSRFAEMSRMGASFPGFSGGVGRNDDNSQGTQATAMEAHIAESRMTADARDGRYWGGNETAMRMRDLSRMTHARKPAEDQHMDEYDGMNMPSDIQQKFAALAEAEARHRMQIEMQSVMLCNRNKGSGAWRETDRATHEQYQRGEMFPPGTDSMTMMPQGSMSPRGRPQNNSSQEGPSLMQRKFMETFGMDLSGGRGFGNVPANRPCDDGVDISQDQEFDLEVDQFLSTLKEEIKENRRKQLRRGGGSGSGSINMPFMRDGGGGNAPSKVGGGFGMESSTTTEMMKNMMAMNSGGAFRNDISPGMMRNMMEMNSQMMEQMIRRFSSGSYGFNKSIRPGPNHPSPGMMEELIRRQVGAGDSSQRRVPMPAPPLWMDEDNRRQHEGRDGGAGQGDDNPALPEYGWRDEGT